MTSPFFASSGNTTGGGTRAGLFRTPISGGVQSATSAHGLPRPALAVRNLMEQVRFLCVVPFLINFFESSSTIKNLLKELLTSPATVLLQP